MSTITRFEVGKKYLNRAGEIVYVREFRAVPWWSHDDCTGTITVIRPDGTQTMLWADGKYAGRGFREQKDESDLISEYFPTPEQEQLDLF